MWEYLGENKRVVRYDHRYIKQADRKLIILNRINKLHE